MLNVLDRFVMHRDHLHGQLIELLPCGVEGIPKGFTPLVLLNCNCRLSFFAEDNFSVVAQ